jgi:hypothetical protein
MRRIVYRLCLSTETLTHERNASVSVTASESSVDSETLVHRRHDRVTLATAKKKVATFLHSPIHHSSLLGPVRSSANY